MSKVTSALEGVSLKVLIGIYWIFVTSVYRVWSLTCISDNFTVSVKICKYPSNINTSQMPLYYTVIHFITFDQVFWKQLSSYQRFLKHLWKLKFYTGRKITGMVCKGKFIYFLKAYIFWIKYLGKDKDSEKACYTVCVGKPHTNHLSNL